MECGQGLSLIGVTVKSVSFSQVGQWTSLSHTCSTWNMIAFLFRSFDMTVVLRMPNRRFNRQTPSCHWPWLSLGSIRLECHCHWLMNVAIAIDSLPICADCGWVGSQAKVSRLVEKGQPGRSCDMLDCPSYLSQPGWPHAHEGWGDEAPWTRYWQLFTVSARIDCVLIAHVAILIAISLTLQCSESWWAAQ